MGLLDMIFGRRRRASIFDFLPFWSDDEGQGVQISSARINDVIEGLNTRGYVIAEQHKKLICLTSKQAKIHTLRIRQHDKDFMLVYMESKAVSPLLSISRRNNESTDQFRIKNIPDPFFGQRLLDKHFVVEGARDSELAFKLRTNSKMFERHRVSISQLRFNENELLLHMLISVTTLRDILRVLEDILT